MIIVMELSTQTVLTGLLYYMYGYESSLEMIYYHICTGQRYLPVCHWVKVKLLTLFLCDNKIGETLYGRCARSLICVSLRRFL